MLTSQGFYGLLLGTCTAQSVHSPKVRHSSSPDYPGTTRHGLDKLSCYSKTGPHRNVIENIHGRPTAQDTCVDSVPWAGNDVSFVKRQAAPPIPTVFSTTTIFTTLTEGAPSTTSTIESTIIDTVTATQLSAGETTEVYTVTSSLTALPNPQKRLSALIEGSAASATVIAQADNAAASTIPSGQGVNVIQNAFPGDWKRQVAATVTSVITVEARTVISASATSFVTNTVRRTSTVIVRPRATTTASITTTIFIGLGDTTVLPPLNQSVPTFSAPAPGATQTANADPMARAIAGVAIGAALIALALVLGMILLLIRRRRRRRRRNKEPKNSTSSVKQYGTTSLSGSSKAAKPRTTSPLKVLSIGIRPPKTDVRSASSEISHRQENFLRGSTSRFDANPPETLEESTSRAQLMPAKKSQLEEVAAECSYSDRTSTASESTTHRILRPLVSNIQRLEAVLAEQAEQPTVAPREWRSSAWPLPDEPFSHMLSRSTSGRLSRSSGTCTTARRYYRYQSSSSPSDPWRSLLPSRSGGGNTIGLQTQLQLQDLEMTTAANKREVVVFDSGEEDGEVCHLQLPSPVKISDVLDSAHIDSALSWRLSTEAELRRESHAKMNSPDGSKWVVDEKEQDRVNRDEAGPYSPIGVALSSPPKGGGLEWSRTVVPVPKPRLRLPPP